MADTFHIPDDYQPSFRRLLPYMAAPLRNDPQVMQSLVLYLKLGGEKLARIALEAFNETQRLNDAEFKKRLREEAMIADPMDDAEDEEDQEDLEQDKEKDQEDESEDY